MDIKINKIGTLIIKKIDNLISSDSKTISRKEEIKINTFNHDLNIFELHFSRL